MFLGTYYSLRDFFWSGVCHTSAASASRELGAPRMKLPARRAELKNECVHPGTWYTWMHDTTQDTAVHKCPDFGIRLLRPTPGN